jgi:hypothetical protein
MRVFLRVFVVRRPGAPYAGCILDREHSRIRRDRMRGRGRPMSTAEQFTRLAERRMTRTQPFVASRDSGVSGRQAGSSHQVGRNRVAADVGWSVMSAAIMLLLVLFAAGALEEAPDVGVTAWLQVSTTQAAPCRPDDGLESCTPPALWVAGGGGVQ